LYGYIPVSLQPECQIRPFVRGNWIHPCFKAGTLLNGRHEPVSATTFPWSKYGFPCERRLNLLGLFARIDDFRCPERAYLLSAEVSCPRTENSQLSVSMAMPFFRALVCRRAVKKPFRQHIGEGWCGRQRGWRRWRHPVASNAAASKFQFVLANSSRFKESIRN